MPGKGLHRPGPETGLAGQLSLYPHGQDPDQRLEQEREISEAEYQALLRQADPALRTLYKQRWCLEYRGQLFEIDLFPFWQDRAFMEIELADEGQELFLPPEIQVIREVTGDRRYTNRALAREIPQETI